MKILVQAPSFLAQALCRELQDTYGFKPPTKTFEKDDYGVYINTETLWAAAARAEYLVGMDRRYTLPNDYNTLIAEISKIIKSPIQKQKQKTMFQFQAKGSLPLLKALREELIALNLGLQMGSDNSTITPETALVCNGSMLYLNRSDSFGKDLVYSLPEGYNAVIAKVKEELTPKTLQFKIGDWVTQTHGVVGRVIADEDEGKQGFHLSYMKTLQNIKEWRLATDAEIEKELIKEANAMGIVIGKKITFTYLNSQQWNVLPSSFKYSDGNLTLSVEYHKPTNSNYAGTFVNNTAWGDIYTRSIGWTVSDIQPFVETPKLTFGGKEVKLTKITNVANDVRIETQGITELYSKMKKFKEAWDTLGKFRFGTHTRILNKPISDEEMKKSPTTITFGCTKGTFGEVFSILDACEKLLNSKYHV